MMKDGSCMAWQATESRGSEGGGGIIFSPIQRLMRKRIPTTKGPFTLPVFDFEI